MPVMKSKKPIRLKKEQTYRLSDLVSPESELIAEAAKEDLVPDVLRKNVNETYKNYFDHCVGQKNKKVANPVVGDWVYQFSEIVQRPLTMQSVASINQDAVKNNIISTCTTEDMAAMIDWARGQTVSSLEDARFCFQIIAAKEHGVSFRYGKYDYPTKLSSYYSCGFFGPYIQLSGTVQLTDFEDQFIVNLSPKVFFDSGDNPVTYTVEELLNKYEVRLTTEAEIEAYKELVRQAKELNSQSGCQVDMTGNGFYEAKGIFGWKTVTNAQLGTVNHPGVGCIEKDLEVGESWECVSTFVRVFDMNMKTYVAVDIRDLRVHQYDKSILSRLILSPEIEPIVRKVFETNPENIFGDLAKGRHGGMVIMASGPPGVGKTFTAESFAEYSERPLYVMNMGELGTNMVDLEKNLKLIFLRAARWNAVLLFDEAEVFLSKRGTDLERSAIVGVFLRMLDYYRGMFFLTTNMPHMIDDAFHSRITLHLRFGEMSWDVRLKIWERMIESSGIKTTVFEGWSHYKELQINGRQIRNVCRLTKIIHDDSPVSVMDICNVAKMSCQKD
jgi:hypothetical protein